MKHRKSVMLKERAKSAKQESTDHHQSQYSPSSLALFATDSLELNWLKQPPTTHNSCMNTYIQDLTWSFSIMRDENIVH